MATAAVLGLGRMGSAMARALARGGTELVLYNRSADRAQRLAGELGARVVSRPADAAAGADVAITMLADGAAVAEDWDGSAGLVAGAHESTVLIDMSTVAPETLHPFAERVRAAGGELLDAPVSGSVQLAETGQLTIMAGGEASGVERARPVLEQMAKTIVHLGPLGSGSAMKLAVNTVIFALNNGLSEGVVLAERYGVDRALAYDVLAQSAVGAPFVAYKRESFVHPDEAPVGFSLDLARKDLALITDFAERLGVPTRQAVANATAIAEAAARLGAERDFSAVAVHLRLTAEERRAAEPIADNHHNR